MSVSDQIIGAESGGDANATNPNSSAGGAGQFIDPTWLSVLRQHRPDLADGKSDADLLALKSDPTLSKQMVDAYATDNGAILAKNGLPVTPGSTYLAHFAGPQGAVSVLSADPQASAASILGPAVVKANPFLANMSAGDLRAWADRKMGGTAPVSRTAALPATGILNQAPVGAATGKPGMLNAGAPSPDEPDLTDVLAKALPPVEQAPVASLPPIRFVAPKGYDRAKFLAALTNRKIA
jgi:hypothetical protein